MRRIIKIIGIVLILTFVFCAGAPIISAQDEQNVPMNLQTALFLKILPFHKGILGKEITIYVMGSSDFVVEIQQYIGKDLGVPYKIKAVKDGVGLPTEKPDIIYLGDSSMFDKVSKYTRENKILSITGIKSLIEKGLSLGVGLIDGKPRIFLNLTSSKEEGISWNPAILKLAKTLA